jgi:hypothetical protein
MKHYLILAVIFITFGACQKKAVITEKEYSILEEQERATLKDEILEDRFTNLLPELMDKADLDMWLLISREYNEDPVLKTMLPATWLNARRRTIIVFYRNKKNNTLERLAVARYDIGKSIKSAWNKEEEPNQWKALEKIISERKPYRSKYKGVFRTIN